MVQLESALHAVRNNNKSFKMTMKYDDKQIQLTVKSIKKKPHQNNEFLKENRVITSLVFRPFHY